MCFSVKDLLEYLFSISNLVGRCLSIEDLFGGLFYEHVVDMCLSSNLNACFLRCVHLNELLMDN